MNRRLSTIVTAATIVLGTALLYLTDLRDARQYPGRDEVFSALTADSIARTGRDLNGRWLPPYFQMPLVFSPEVSLPPVMTYSLALMLKVMPLTEATMRLPMAALGIVDVLLMYVVGRMFFRREWIAAAAAVLLAITPAHFTFSRNAFDYQALLPFILGWLLCLLTFIDRGRPGWLFAAGLILGAGVHAYVAAYVLMPLYLLLTFVTLYRRHETLTSYGIVALGFLIPVSVSVIYLLQHPSAASDMVVHYARDESRPLGLVPVTGTLARAQLVADRIFVYARLVNPRTLFIRAREFVRPHGMFLTPIAGLILIGMFRTLARRTTTDQLVAFGFFSAPLPAMLVNQPDVVHRALAMLPFGVLLAAVGLDDIWNATTPRARNAGFVVMWGTVIVLALFYAPDLPRAQAILRAAAVPLVVVCAAVILRPLSLRTVSGVEMAVVVCLVLAGLQIVSMTVDPLIVTRWSPIVATPIGAAAVFPSLRERVHRTPMAAVALLAVAVSLFLFTYVDYTKIPAVPLLRASVAAPILRFSGAVLATVALFATVRSFHAGLASRTSAVAAVLALVLIEIACFYIDVAPGFPLRFVQAMVVMAGIVAVALRCRREVDGQLRLRQISGAGLFALIALQAALFFFSYLPRHRGLAALDDRLTRLAFETTIARAKGRDVQAVYLGNIGLFRDSYWRLFAIEQGRRDLADRTFAELVLTPDRISGLPTGGLAVVGASLEADRRIAEMIGKRLVDADGVDAPDGKRMFWLIERLAR